MLIGVLGQHGHDQHGASANSSSTVTAPTLSGEVKQIDEDAGKITIQHGPLVNLNMPGMLDHVCAGDKISFHAERVNGAFTVTRLEAAR